MKKGHTHKSEAWAHPKLGAIGQGKLPLSRDGSLKLSPHDPLQGSMPLTYLLSFCSLNHFCSFLLFTLLPMPPSDLKSKWRSCVLVTTRTMAAFVAAYLWQLLAEPLFMEAVVSDKFFKRGSRPFFFLGFCSLDQALTILCF